MCEQGAPVEGNSSDEDIPLCILASREDAEDDLKHKNSALVARAEKPSISKTERARSRRKSSRRGKENDDHKETLWDIVCRNVRPKTKDEEQRNDLQANFRNNELGGLFDGTGAVGGFNGDALDSLLGGDAVPKNKAFSSSEAPVLSLDAEGNFLMDDATSGIGGGLSNDMSELLEGKTSEVVTLAYDTQIQPYEGAYKKTKATRWSTHDTERLYKAMELFGSDLMLVKTLLPEFTDKQIHDKYKIENKRNPHKVTASLEKRARASNAKRMIELFESAQGREIDPSTHFRSDEDTYHAPTLSFMQHRTPSQRDPETDLIESLTGILSTKEHQIDSIEDSRLEVDEDPILSLFS